MPRFAYLIDDLTAIDTKALGARAMATVAKLALAALRDVRGSDDLERLVARWTDLLSVLREPTEVRAMDAIFRYIMAVKSQVDVQHLADAMGAFSPELSEQVMSTARELIEQGRQEGRQEGRVETLRATLLRQLVKRFGDLPSDVRHRIEAANATDLDRWSDGVVEAASLAEIFDAA